MRYLTWNDIRIPSRKAGSRKGDNGKVLVIGGSREYVGAVALAGIAALCAGADWVTVFTTEKVGWAVNALSPDLVVSKVKGDYLSIRHVRKALEIEKKHDVVLIGNGISMKSGSFVRAFIRKSKKPMVLDADALKFVSIADVHDSILTPHEREYQILLQNSAFPKTADIRRFVGNNVVIRKGPVDQIIAIKGLYYNKTGNAGMTKAGTGDVLAGIAAGFYAQSGNALESAKAAAYISGMAGDILLKRRKGFTYLASDIADEIKKILKKARRNPAKSCEQQ